MAKLEFPRKHYQSYYRTKSANYEMMNSKQGLKSFIRAYYHYKSFDWKNNKPFEINLWDAKELSKIPTYYIMDKQKNDIKNIHKSISKLYIYIYIHLYINK